jgi:protein-S-isoprenylcysteine O-methyltransferase Ste14
VTSSSRTRIALVAAGAHAIAVLCWVVAWHGLEGLRSTAWLVAIGASTAVATEVFAQSRDDRHDQPWLETMTGLLLLALVLAASLGTARGASLGIGAACLAVGIALRGVAILTLGGAFATRPRGDERLVEHGIYRWLSHPSELGLLVLTVGLSLLAAHPLATFGAVVLSVIAAARVRAETAELRRRFG